MMIFILFEERRVGKHQQKHIHNYRQVGAIFISTFPHKLVTGDQLSSALEFSLILTFIDNIWMKVVEKMQ